MSEAPVRSRLRPRQPPDKQPRKRSWGRILGLVLLGLLVLIPVTGFAALKGWVPEPILTATARLFVGRQPGAVPWDSGTPANVLVMGLQIGGVSTNPLTDSLMVVSYQPGAEQVSLLSVPRDLYVEIPGHGSGRINEAFQDGGPQEALLTVQQNLGVPVNYYALVSYTAFQKLIDDVGGVTVDVPKEIDDPSFPAEDEIHFEPFHITQGSHHLDGREALRYARTRHADTDFGRAQRQQQVLMAVAKQMLKPANWFKLPLIMRDLRATVRTNFPMDQGLALGLRALRAKDTAHQEVLQYGNKAVQGFTTASGADVLAPNAKVVKGIVADLFGPSLELLQNAGPIRVDNGNGYSGAATQFSKVLTNMGATVMEPGDADRTDLATHQVTVYGGNRATMRAARLIAGMLGTTAGEGRGKGGGAEIVVSLGRNYAPFVPFREKDWQEAIAPR
jgi:polyisoprenyl-teichoic acid--peptidoglycan teichoic acid transferase